MEMEQQNDIGKCFFEEKNGNEKRTHTEKQEEEDVVDGEKPYNPLDPKIE